MKYSARFCCLLIRFYQSYISPLFPQSCRFYPTCSAYTHEAVQKYGAARGCFLGLRRIIRCNPFWRGGYDPLPQRHGAPEARFSMMRSSL